MTGNLIETIARKLSCSESYARRAIFDILEEIREPTPQMREAGCVYEPGTIDDPYNLIPGTVWRVMIDALRAEIESA